MTETSIIEQSTAPEGAVLVSGGWRFAGSKGKGGSSARQPVESPDSLHSTSYARILLLLSEGPCKGLKNGLRSIYLDGTPLQNEDGSLNFSGVTVDYRSGTQTQDYIPGFPASESTIGVGVPLTADQPWTRFSSDTQLSAMRVTIAANGLLRLNESNGDRGGYRVDYAIDLSTDGSAFQEKLRGAFDGKTTTTYARSHRIDLPRAETGWTIRVRRLTPDSTSSAITDDTVIQSVSDIIDGKLRHPMWAMLGIQLDASQFSSVPTVAVDHYGREIRVPSNYEPETRTYSGVWDGTFKIAWTNNPAWIFYDLVTHVRYGLGELIPEAWVDKWSLYQIARYCDEAVPDGKGGTEPRFTCNPYMQVAGDAYRVLQDLAATFRGMVYWGSGVAIPVADMPRDPAYTYTNANVVNGRFTYSGTRRKTRYTKALVSWNDMSDMGRQKVEAIDDADGIQRYGLQETQITTFGCTSQGQAQRVGKWMLLTSLMETRSVQFSVGLEGAIAAPGQVVRVADQNLAGKAIGGRISWATWEYVTVNGEIVTVEGDPVTVEVPDGAGPSLRTVTLDRVVDAQPGDTITITMPSGVPETRTIAIAAGRLITVTEDFSATPEAEAQWVIESTELAAQLFRVISVTEGDGNTFNIAAVQHEPGKFAAIDTGTRIEPPPITVVPPSVQPAPEAVTIEAYEVVAQGVSSTTVRITWDAVQHASEYAVQWRRDNSDWVTMPRTGTTSAEIENAYTGGYIARVRARSAIGSESIWRNSTLTQVDGLMAAPPVVSSLTTVGILFGISLNWSIPAGPNIIERTEIWYSETNNRADAIKLGEFAYPQQQHTLVGLAAGKQLFFWARLIDKNGTVGEWYPSVNGVSGTASADAGPILDYLAGKITETQLAQQLLDMINSGGESAVIIQQVVNELAALWTLRAQLSVDGQTYIAGIAVGVEQDEGEVISQVLIAADRLAVLDPDTEGSVTTPFVIQGGQVFINSAVIADASIGSAKFADVTSSDAEIGGEPVLSINWRTGDIKHKAVDGTGASSEFSGTTWEVTASNGVKVIEIGLYP